MDFRIATLKELLGRGHLCSGRIHDPRLAVQLLQYFNKAKSQPVSALQQLISELEKQYETLKFILCDVWGHILIIQPIGSENAIACSYKIEDLDLSLVSEIITERSFSYRLRPVLKSLSGVTSLQISCPDEELPEQWDSDFLSRLVNLRLAPALTQSSLFLAMKSELEKPLLDPEQIPESRWSCIDLVYSSDTEDEDVCEMCLSTMCDTLLITLIVVNCLLLFNAKSLVAWCITAFIQALLCLYYIYSDVFHCRRKFIIALVICTVLLNFVEIVQIVI